MFYQVLILDTDSKRTGTILKVLAERDLRGTVAKSWKSGKQLLDKYQWNLIFLSTDYLAVSDKNDGYSVLCHILSQHPEMPVIMVSSSDSAVEALKAIRFGCVDFFADPLCPCLIEKVLDNYLPNHPIHAVATVETERNNVQPIIGRSTGLKDVVEMSRSVAPTAAPVLVRGPSGTGKELIAALIHNQSRRSEGPFVRVNCAALSESLLESELFGHEKGAFTGAILSHQGRLERAHGGTILLDEVTETQPAFQAKLLRALEQMHFERVGGTQPIRVNVRVISTTNQDIYQLVQRGEFRADLYYRLAAVQLQIPSLQERIEDLPDLIWWFVNQFAHEAGRKITGISAKTLRLFELYHWPGNIRQLRNTVRTAMILGRGQTLCITQIPWLLEEMKNMHQAEIVEEDLGGTPLQEVERRAILATLAQTEGNQTQAARVLGIAAEPCVKKSKSTVRKN
jgi:DNA-binding NtrC family response regulator